MLYSILNDHIYKLPTCFINKLFFVSQTNMYSSSIYNYFIKKSFIIIFNILFYIKDIQNTFFFKKIEKILINLNNPKADKILYFLYCVIYFIKFFIFSIFGFQYTTSMKFLSNFSFLNDDELSNKFINHYDLNNKLLFSGCDSNILSLQGKFFEMEDVYLLSQLSFDFNLLKLEEFIKEILTPDFKTSLNINISNNGEVIKDPIMYSWKTWNDSNDIFNIYNYLYDLFNNEVKYFIDIKNIVNNNNLFNGDLELMADNTVLDEIYCERILYFVDLFRSYNNEFCKQINDSSEIDEFFIIKSDTNKILRQNLNFQESFYYNRRLNQISFYFNPYIEVFNDFFNLNNNNNEFYSITSVNDYKWWEFQYLYTMIKTRKNYFNLSNLTYSINRDIIIHSWEYHHSMSFEYIWALFPTIVILSIVGPSFILLYSSVSYNDSFFTVKVIGHQWYWSYELTSDSISNESINFESHLQEVLEDKLINIDSDFYGHRRLLNVDKHLILIAHKPINFLITSADVLHSFAIPAMGIKVDAVPGRINTFYLGGSRIGIFYGQCSELCGFGHGFMPIVLEVVPLKDN